VWWGVELGRLPRGNEFVSLKIKLIFFLYRSGTCLTQNNGKILERYYKNTFSTFILNPFMYFKRN
jgi:hypothetical protein